MDHIRRNVKELIQDIEAHSPGRDVTLVAVSKTVGEAEIRAAYKLGLRDFGENRALDFVKKAELLADLPDLRWHFIGHLQTNKVKKVVGKAHLIHSVDSARLLRAVSAAAASFGVVARVLVQVNTSGEQSKYGLPPDEARKLVAEAGDLEALRIDGLMTMAPFTADENEIRPVFAKLRALRDELRAEKSPHFDGRYLSMGMTNDYRIALEEGGNMLRVGTRIFAKSP